MNAAAVQHFGSLTAKILFTLLQQYLCHFCLGAIRPQHDDRCDPQIERYCIELFVGTESGMSETHGQVVLKGKNQAFVVEIEFSENKLFQEIGRNLSQNTGLNCPASPEGR